MPDVGSTPPICEHPVFIIGSPRSGTTILAWSLAQHSQFWTRGEFHLFSRLFGGGRLIDKFEREEVFPGFIRDEGVARAEFLAFLGLGFNALFASRSKGKRWVEQTPGNTMLVGLMAEMFPGAQFVHLLREGASTVNSMIHFENVHAKDVRSAIDSAGYYPAWATDFTEACKTWSESVTAAMEFALKCPDRCLTIRYETLIASPAAAFHELSRFLGVDEEPAPARYFAEVRVNSSFTTSMPERVGVQVSSNRVNEWTPDQRRVFMEIAGPVATKYGLSLGLTSP